MSAGPERAVQLENSEKVSPKKLQKRPECQFTPCHGYPNWRLPDVRLWYSPGISRMHLGSAGPLVFEGGNSVEM